MSRVTATDRVQRILAVLPWILQHQGATVDEICERFGLGRKELLADLDFVFYNVGLHPFTPDMLAEVAIDEDRVTVHLGDYFRRPLRLTHEEALTLLAAGRALAARPGTDPDGTLQRAVDKLSAALGEGAADAVEVALGEADPVVLAAARQAVEQHRRLSIDYYSYGRDEPSSRQVDPYRLVAREGHWYLLAWCHTADGERLFRVDRIRAATIEDVTFDPPTEAGEAGFDLSESLLHRRVASPRRRDARGWRRPTLRRGRGAGRRAPAHRAAGDRHAVVGAPPAATRSGHHSHRPGLRRVAGRHRSLGRAAHPPTVRAAPGALRPPVAWPDDRPDRG
jgi:proteasome accessory factor C